ncbi:unnamed protein product [Dicrocoelium dendriticum]|nr:unnamed protein product [Dicrocoelium dendriticum]
MEELRIYQRTHAMTPPTQIGYSMVKRERVFIPSKDAVVLHPTTNILVCLWSFNRSLHVTMYVPLVIQSQMYRVIEFEDKCVAVAHSTWMKREDKSARLLLVVPLLTVLIYYRSSMSEAFVTLATTDEYVCGALVLATSLREVKTTKQLACLLTKGVSPHMQDLCRRIFDYVEIVDVLDSKDVVNLTLLARPDLGVTFTKLHCWRLTQYQKAVFLDADTLVIQNIDDLFEREELSAAPDPGWPDCFNSGVFVFVPNMDTYTSLLNFAVTTGSFDGGDQHYLLHSKPRIASSGFPTSICDLAVTGP